MVFLSICTTFVDMITYPIAKINLGLNVVEKRSDGYHNLQTVFYPVPVKDALEVQEMDEGFPSEVDCDLKVTNIVIEGDEQRILVDKGYCRESDFDGFDAFIRRVMPKEVNKPYKKESVKQISKTDFALPFDRWHYDPQTSTTRKPYDRMVAVTGRFKEILEQKGL